MVHHHAAFLRRNYQSCGWAPVVRWVQVVTGAVLAPQHLPLGPVRGLDRPDEQGIGHDATPPRSLVIEKSARPQPAFLRRTQ